VVENGAADEEGVALAVVVVVVVVGIIVVAKGAMCRNEAGDDAGDAAVVEGLSRHLQQF
jgi:hypothetical protein